MPSFFITEKETEELLQTETRDVLMQNGSRKPYSNFKIHWDDLDYILEFSDYSEEDLTSIAFMLSVEDGTPFRETYFKTLYTVEKMVTKDVKERIDYIRNRLGIVEGKAKREFNSVC